MVPVIHGRNIVKLHISVFGVLSKAIDEYPKEIIKKTKKKNPPKKFKIEAIYRVLGIEKMKQRV